MPNAFADDGDLFETTPAELLAAVRSAAAGEVVPEREGYLLQRSGLLAEGRLTPAGKALFKLAWVLRRTKDAEAALGQALRVLTPLQVIEQELRGLGPVPEDGVLDLLRQHRAVTAEVTVETMRPSFRWLNSVGVLTFSTKYKTVRSLAPAPGSALAGEVQMIAAMVSPKTPFSNLVRLRRVLRSLKGTVWWADPHFSVRALEELVEELDSSRVRAVRILSGDASNVISDKSGKDFDRFAQEMGNRSIDAEWRVDTTSVRDWHDRWIADDSTTWNVPPVNTLFKSDYSEIYPGSERPPLQEWWARSTPRG